MVPVCTTRGPFYGRNMLRVVVAPSIGQASACLIYPSPPSKSGFILKHDTLIRRWHVHALRGCAALFYGSFSGPPPRENSTYDHMGYMIYTNRRKAC